MKDIYTRALFLAGCLVAVLVVAGNKPQPLVFGALEDRAVQVAGEVATAIATAHRRAAETDPSQLARISP